MKTYLLNRIVVFIVILAAVLFAYIMIAQGAEQTASITYISGHVDFERQTANGETVYIGPASIGMRLGENYLIRTGTNSLCEIQDSNKNIIKIMDNAVFDIKSLSSKHKKFKLIRGRMLAIVRKLGRKRKFEVGTATALAGVRGTIYAIDNRISETDIIVFRGKVEVSSPHNSYEPILVKEGEMVTVNYNMTEQIVPIPKDINDEWQKSVSKEKHKGGTLVLGTAAIIFMLLVIR